MNPMSFDVEELQQKLVKLAQDAYGFNEFRPDTPMHEIRAKAEQAGMMYGRMLGAALYAGPINADIAMTIRIEEQEGKERFLASVERLAGPGGSLRS